LTQPNWQDNLKLLLVQWVINTYLG